MVKGIIHGIDTKPINIKSNKLSPDQPLTAIEMGKLWYIRRKQHVKKDFKLFSSPCDR